MKIDSLSGLLCLVSVLATGVEGGASPPPPASQSALNQPEDRSKDLHDEPATNAMPIDAGSNPGQGTGIGVVSPTGPHETSIGKVDVIENPAVAGNTAFALDLYGQLRTPAGNLFFSPYSISTALAMTYAGARGGTETQMARTLRFDLPPEKLHPALAALAAELKTIETQGRVQLSVANSLWPQQGFPLLPAYLELLQQHYATAVTPLDYQRNTDEARRTINDWVEAKTNHKITDLLKPGMVDSLTRLVLVNAVYFKGDWLNQFDPKRTMEQPFHVTTNQEVKCQMMSRQGRYAYAKTPDLQVLELPYAGGELSMVVLLPRKPEGIDALEGELTPAKLAEWTQALHVAGPVAVYLPKFKLTCAFSLRKALVAMGMTDAFAAERADFSGMDGRRWLYISAVVHKAFVDVQEEGTEAAAATAVVMAPRGGSMRRPPVPVFRADHPFVFLIRENHTGNILFLGRVTTPST